ncbi:Junctophilin-3 [Fasciola gigantica]|uniref:Junctophilin-3 n=1 Tax=Fasciola gigantica TaxID=46835 RepID=A0A504YLI7_FASGI|nr:Junctophilin-3 [Fasciola gigantica]
MTNETNQPAATCLPAGRYEFKDSGLYIGEWLNEKAVGLGLITKDKCQGEYTGLWDAGTEKSGVFLWPNAPGAMYEGEWAHNRRNGYGVFTREDWVIMGKFKEDFIILGIKCKENSIGRFEGEFENGFPSFGVETYADGGSYAGEYKNGIREGLGVRTSIPYGEVINFFPEEAALAAELLLQAKRQAAQRDAQLHRDVRRRSSLLSQRSGDVAEIENADEDNLDTDEEEEPYFGRKTTNQPTLGMKPLTTTGTEVGRAGEVTTTPTPAPTGGLRDLRMSSKFKCGFVLSSQRSELVLRRQNKLGANAPNPVGTGRKSREAGYRSTGHTRARSLTNLFGRSSSRESIHRMKRQGSANERSNYTTYKPIQSESVFTLDQDDAIDPETVETFAGQWESDTRHGYGVCERSDGVTYEGQWLKNQRHGFGQTRFQDGTCEQGRYQYGKLVFLSWSKGTKPHMLLYNYHIMREVAASVKRARVIAEQARLRAAEARENLENVHASVERSKQAAELARDYSLETRELVKEMYPDFEQPGIKYLDDMVRLMRATRRGNQAFESALEAAHEVIAGVDKAQALEAEKKARLAEQNEIPFAEDSVRRSSQNLEVSPGSPVSRAGSYRRRKRSRLRSRSSRNQADMVRQSPNTARDKHRTSQSPSQQHQPLTLVVPQFAKADEHRVPNIPNDQSGVTNAFSLPVPDNRARQTAPGEVDSVGSDMEAEVNTGLRRTPSVVTTYVVLPRLIDLHPESEIPTVPLAKLITNTNLLADHFDHYTRAQVNSGTAASSTAATSNPKVINTSTVSNRSPMGSPGDGSPTAPGLLAPGLGEMHNQAASMDPSCTVPVSEQQTTESSATHGLIRRRTMPVFMTQKPVNIKFRKNMPTAAEQTRKVPLGSDANRPNGYIKSPSPSGTGEHRPIPGTPISRDQLLHGTASIELIAEELEELAAAAVAEQDDPYSTIYLIEEGVRKRVQAHIISQPKSKATLTPSDAAVRLTDPNWDRAIVPISNDENKKIVSVHPLSTGDRGPQVTVEGTNVSTLRSIRFSSCTFTNPERSPRCRQYLVRRLARLPAPTSDQLQRDCGRVD